MLMLSGVQCGELWACIADITALSNITEELANEAFVGEGG